MPPARTSYLPERLHAVRISVKKLRYALEVASEARGAAPRAELALLKHSQDLLGRLHDLQVLIDRARQVQAALAPPNITTWRGLEALVDVLEDDCRRRLHARYIRASGTALLAHTAAGSPAAGATAAAPSDGVTAMPAPIQLYLIRHGIAEERGEAWPDDTRRPLTDEGMARLRKIGARPSTALGVALPGHARAPWPARSSAPGRRPTSSRGGASIRAPHVVMLGAARAGRHVSRPSWGSLAKHGRRAHVALVGHRAWPRRSSRRGSSAPRHSIP